MGELCPRRPAGQQWRTVTAAFCPSSDARLVVTLTPGRRNDRSRGATLRTDRRGRKPVPGQREPAGVEVRAARDDDDLDALNVGNFAWWGAEKQRELLVNGPPDIPREMLVGVLDGAPVGYGHSVAAPAAALGYGIGAVFVLPAARRHGVGHLLFDRVVENARRGHVAGVMFAVHDGDVASLEVAQHWGLQNHGHHFESVLDLAGLENAMLDAAVEASREQGYEIRQLGHDADEALWRATYDFFAARFHETPDSREGGGEFPYEIFRTFAVEPWQVLVATRDGALAGITA